MGNNNSLPWNSLFATTSWFCWKQRNDHIFNNRTSDVNLVLNSIFSHIKCYLESSSVSNTVNLVQDHVGGGNSTREAPVMGSAKINVDGAYWQLDDSISCGGSIRNSDGIGFQALPRIWAKVLFSKLSYGGSSLAYTLLGTRTCVGWC
ncbi:reverse transcriptase [Senna tora]|uniref:Reverse transcriptase n=1 Tax=Senna tora TaxID=362788 RepID=A0A834TJQ8_9FABA|nr:reverse transcriptase [Senna tora]